MKTIALLAATAVSVNAIATTTRDCYSDDSVLHLTDCRSLWYAICDEYEIDGGATCNFETFGDAQLAWFSDSLEVFMWNYVMKVDDADNAGGDNWNLRAGRTCQQDSLGNSVYKSEQRVLARNGDCGFKFQIKNNAEYGSYDFTLLRNSAEYLTAGVAIMVAGALL
jgi:hypothetical protein